MLFEDGDAMEQVCQDKPSHPNMKALVSRPLGQETWLVVILLPAFTQFLA